MDDDVGPQSRRSKKHPGTSKTKPQGSRLLAAVPSVSSSAVSCDFDMEEEEEEREDSCSQVAESAMCFGRDDDGETAVSFGEDVNDCLGDDVAESAISFGDDAGDAPDTQDAESAISFGGASRVSSQLRGPCGRPGGGRQRSGRGGGPKQPMRTSK
eukprot:2582893-Prymnesium_polylepis.1